MSKTKLMLGDNIESLKKLPDNSVDSVVTDGPYGLSFMNKRWDYDVPSVEFWKEVYRVLKPGGHFSISDVVLVGALPEGLRKDAEMYAGCVSGAIQKEVYMELIHANGFEQVTIQKEKPIIIPDDILINYLTPEQLIAFKNGDTGIFSVTVFAISKSFII